MKIIFSQVILDVETRIMAILRNGSLFNSSGITDEQVIEKTREIMGPAIDMAENDFARETDTSLSRAVPIDIGEAVSMNIPKSIKNTSTMPKEKARIYLVGANTDFTKLEDFEQRLIVEMRQVRPYVQKRPEDKTEKAFKYFLKQRLWGMHKNSDEIVDDLASFMMVRGKYIVKNPEHLQASQKICLYYCNCLDKNRCILMLRASNDKCQKASYEAYCQIVIGAMLKRMNGVLHLDETNCAWPIKESFIRETMYVPDQLLIDRIGKHDDEIDVEGVEMTPPVDEKLING